MRKHRFIFPVLVLILVMMITPLTVFADQMWSEQYYRAYDTTGTLTEQEQKDVDQVACDFIEKYHYDLVLMTVDSDSYSGTLEEEAESIYTGNGFGYGEDASGLIFAYDVDTSEVVYLKFGTAQEEVEDVFLDALKDQVPGFYDSHQAFGVMYFFELSMQDYEDGVYDEALGRTTETESADVSDAAIASTENAAEETEEKEQAAAVTDPDLIAFRECVENSGIERVGDGSNSKPYWYPVSTDNYQFYNDASIPRVVDEAGIFTDEEKAEMKALIAEITADSEADIVVFTDTSNYRLGNNVYAADFYDFNGYGFGDENEGICLMICMDPSYRGWYACVTGTDTRSLYTESAADALDDRLYVYMSKGDYGEGVLDWIRNIGTLYQKGIPFAPDWCPDRGQTVSAEEAASAARVVDYAGMFTQEQIEELSTEVASLSEKYGMDVVIDTTSDDYTLGSEGYSELFYERNGYGLGDDHSGFCLTLFTSGVSVFSGYGAANDKLTSVNYDRIDSYTSRYADEGQYYEAAKTWLKHIEHMERTGRVMRQTWIWIAQAVVAGILAFFISAAALKRAKKKMETVELSWNADDYIDGQPTLMVIKDIFLQSTVLRKHKEPKSSSHSSGSHSSHSSYSSSYKGSSGRSHSGSGRRF